MKNFLFVKNGWKAILSIKSDFVINKSEFCGLKLILIGVHLIVPA